jgi:hypothetical protein
MIERLGRTSERHGLVTDHGCAAFQWFHTVMAMMIPKPTWSTIDAAIMRSDDGLAGRTGAPSRGRSGV